MEIEDIYKNGKIQIQLLLKLNLNNQYLVLLKTFIQIQLLLKLNLAPAAPSAPAGPIQIQLLLKLNSTLPLRSAYQFLFKYNSC